MVRRLYPYGRKKAFNVTYDDGVLQDVRFVELLNQYGLKGTFNLNSALMEKEFEWIHEKGCVVKRLGMDTVKSLYAGHEIASHTLNHPYMYNLSKEGIMWELSEDKRSLEALFGKEIKGFAVPFDYYSDLIEECVKECGFAYGRISEMCYSFRPQSDFYRWKATVFHCEACLEELTTKFLETDEELALFQIVGHSYDLDTENMWDRMEAVFGRISGQDDVLAMTTIEIIEYLKAMEQAEITDQYIKNRSDRSLWFAVNDTVCEVKPNEKKQISKSGKASIQIEHIAMYVNDLEKTRDFFVKYFDATANEGYHNKTTDFRSYFLSFGSSARLEIMNRPQMSDAEKGLHRTGYIHIAFSLGSKAAVDALAERLQKDGYEVISGPRTTGDGYYESCIVGVEENQIEITV